MNNPSLDHYRYVVKLPSAMVATRVHGMTTIQNQLLMTLLNHAQKTCNQKDVPKNTKFYMPVKDIVEIPCFRWMRRLEIIANLNALLDLKYEYNILKKDKKEWREAGCILSSVGLNEDHKCVMYKFNVDLQDYVLDPDPYAAINLRMAYNVDVERADLLYMFLFDYINAPQVKTLAIEEFRDVLRLKPSIHKTFKNFRAHVIDPIKREVNLKTDLMCDYDLIVGKYPNITHIKWTFSVKPGTFAAERCKDKSKILPYGNTDNFFEDDRTAIPDTKTISTDVSEEDMEERDARLPEKPSPQTEEEWIAYFINEELYAPDYAKIMARDKMENKEDDFDA